VTILIDPIYPQVQVSPVIYNAKRVEIQNFVCINYTSMGKLQAISRLKGLDVNRNMSF